MTVDSDAPVGLTDEQRAFIDGLRELADFAEANPGLRAGRADYGATFIVNANVYGDDEGETARERLARIARLPGRWDKESGDDAFRLRRKFGPHTLIVFASSEQVCERVQTGTRTVQRPIEEAAPVATVEVEEPIYEWVCPPSLLAEVGGDHA